MSEDEQIGGQDSARHRVDLGDRAGDRAGAGRRGRAGDAQRLRRSRETIAAISAELGAVHDGADLSDPAAIAAMMERCAAELGAPDILVNNAGIQHVAPVDEFPVEKWDAVIAINLERRLPHHPAGASRR